jgi:hypothetical protein
MAALVLNPLAVFKMEKIAWHTGTSRRPNKRSCRRAGVRGCQRDILDRDARRFG